MTGLVACFLLAACGGSGKQEAGSGRRDRASEFLAGIDHSGFDRRILQTTGFLGDQM